VFVSKKVNAQTWLAYDMRLRMRHYQEDGVSASVAVLGPTNTVLSRAACSYRAFAEAVAVAAWVKNSIRFRERTGGVRLAPRNVEDAVPGQAGTTARAQRVSASGVRVEDLCGVDACDMGPASWHGSGTQDPSGACW
jgi:hypothetical protein